MSFKVGSIVVSKDFGEGRVINILSDVGESHPIVVRFTGSNLPYRFKLNGQYWLSTIDEDADIKLKETTV